MPKTDANGVTLHYQRVGKTGPELVMLHGLTGNLAVWHLRIVPRLQSQFRVTTYDLRGHGYSDMPPSGYTTRAMAEDLKGLLDALDIEKPMLVGHSFGADIALHFSLINPDRVRGVIAIEAGLAALVAGRKREDWEGWRYWREVLGRFGIEIPREHWYDYEYLMEQSLKVPKVYGPATGLPRKAEPLLNLLRTTTVVSDYEDPDGLTLDRIPEIDVPVLLIYSDGSAFIETHDYLLSHLPQAASVKIPHGDWGHFGPLEHPEVLIEQIQAYCGLAPAKRGGQNTV
ncbi:MAG: alpha/beta fold hydrolase [Chloroflexota bacterium]